MVLYLTCLLGRILMGGGFSVPLIFCSIYDKTPGLNEFFLFVLRSVYITTAVLCVFNRVSNHIIITLDILFLFSTMLIYLYHLLKIFNRPYLSKSYAI
jgi:hypothetical protein